jgi:heme exporter protein A
MSAALDLDHVSRRFGSTRALDDVELHVPRGAAVALLGPNGAGKTTMIRVCATLLRPSHGAVRILGLDAAREGRAVRRRIAMLGHDSWLYPDLSPRENLRVYARLFGIADPQARITALLERLGITGWSHRPVRALSRGLLQRCALARVLLHDPELLFLDEPFTGLDLDARELLCAVLREAHERGATVVMSTHDLGLGLTLCSTAVVLVRGRIAWHGAVAPGDGEGFEARYRRLTQGTPTDPTRGGAHAAQA